jgi:hypothetical protein
VKSILRRRPSAALAISMVALFVSLSGVSYGVATGFIDSREIKNNTIRGVDIRNGKVPKAARADGVSSLKQLPLTRLAEGSARTTILSHGPLTLSAECVATSYGPSTSGTRLRILLNIEGKDGPAEIAFAEHLEGGTEPHATLESVSGMASSGKSFTGQLGLVADRNRSPRSCSLYGHLALQG